MFPSVGAPASANAACRRPRITRSRGPWSHGLNARAPS